MLVPVIGAFWFLLYYVTFRFLITKFNFMTPGRSDETAVKAADVDASDRTTAIIAALGGDANIDTVDCCATRLRVTVNDHQHVREDLLKATGAHGVVQKGNGIQVIYGPSVTIIKNEVQEALGRGE
jgi:PTS system maltose and glucose-specific IIC component